VLDKYIHSNLVTLLLIYLFMWRHNVVEMTRRFGIYSYNRSQQDAQFLNFILIKNSTYFGQTYCPSSGVLILYSQQLVFVMLVMLTVCQRGPDPIKIKLRNSASCWLLVYEHITMLGPQNFKQVWDIFSIPSSGLVKHVYRYIVIYNCTFCVLRAEHYRCLLLPHRVCFITNVKLPTTTHV